MMLGFDKDRELLEQANDFERVVEASERYCDPESRLSRFVSLFFAMKSAFLVHASIAPDGRKTAMDGARDVWTFVEQESLPDHNAVHNAVQKLVVAITSNNRADAMNAIEEMGVFALCPAPDTQLERMERLVANVSGRARLMFLVELSLFAAELGEFNTVRKSVTQAWSLYPSGWELYNLCIFEGTFALKAGDLDEAIRLLGMSLSACQTDGHTLISCGLRPPNFLLVQRLFERGARSAVLKHLVDCQTVWRHSSLPMGNWIASIENGQAPNFHHSKGLKSMALSSCRVDLQWRRVRALETEKSPSKTGPRKSPTEVVIEKEKLLSDVDRYISRKVDEAISYLDKELDAPPDRPPSNSTESDS